MSAEVKFMTLSNAKESGQGPYVWGGHPGFTKDETDAVNGVRGDGDNINTLIFCCADPLSSETVVFQHSCNPTHHGTYKFNSTTFKARTPKEYPTHPGADPAGQCDWQE